MLMSCFVSEELSFGYSADTFFRCLLFPLIDGDTKHECFSRCGLI